MAVPQTPIMHLCSVCTCPVPITRAVGAVGDRRLVRVGFECPRCGSIDAHEMPLQMYRHFLIAWQQARQVLSPTEAETLHNRVNSEMLGRMVQGGRIELDAVETVDDIQLLWDYQEDTDPESVPRER